MEGEEKVTRGTLKEREPHQAALDALAWIRGIPVNELFIWSESFASNAIEGNRLAEVCGETLDRLMRGDPVSDRYVLGLAWAMKYGEEE